jgi:hypothetical protein
VKAAAVALAIAIGAVATTVVAAPPEWIDTDVHLAGGATADSDIQEAARAAVEVMDRSHLRAMVVVPMPHTGGSAAAPDHEQFLAAVRNYPRRFAFLGGGGSLNRILHERASASLVDESVRRRFAERARKILADGAAGFGQMVAHHLSSRASPLPYASVPADHPLLLTLADIAAERRALIALHLDPVVTQVDTPASLRTAITPASLTPNVEGLERLLEHNRGARVVWGPAGADALGQWTAELTARLLQSHENLFISIRPGGALVNRLLNERGELRREWLELLRAFPDRFVLGGGQSFVPAGALAEGRGRIRSSAGRGGHGAPPLGGSTVLRSGQTSGAGVASPGDPTAAAKAAEGQRRAAAALLEALPEELARKVGYENAVRLYRVGG